MRWSLLISVHFGFSYGWVPYCVALHTCDGCGESVLEPDVAKRAPEGWLFKGAGMHFCPHCAALRLPTDQETVVNLW